MKRVWQECIECRSVYDADAVRYRCDCGGLLEVSIDIESLGDISWERFRSRRFNVWRYIELLPFEDHEHAVSLEEGGTPLYKADRLAEWLGAKNVYIKYEGMNPTGSFKDRGMCVGITKALKLGARGVACASTGNTAASLAAYSAKAGIPCIVVVPKEVVALGKLFQALLYGAKVVRLHGTFDEALSLVWKASEEVGVYLLNSINPWRLEGQKTVAFETVDQLGRVPRYVVLPVGNCGNIAAAWKGFKEMEMAGLINEKPSMVGIQSEGASPFVDLVKEGLETLRPVETPKTVASAIRIGRPVNWKKALLAVKESGGLVAKVSDAEIIQAQRMLASLEGIGVEPAAAASVAGVKKLIESGDIDADETIVCVCTGSMLKDPNPELIKGLEPTEIVPELGLVRDLLASLLSR
ncbi:MAG: threonine synthase [Candidatus Terraquivivens tikiterensis]|uniref:Threonine synthase n=1 Tax=Candidatus Terraquivivens tikiterensis TaxID=1980982 RepID=A0A2R7Y9B1_9ARCH|nr:MAG: threonine synthase [Candidatus Terraquivivens tikiterensis]